MANDLPRFIETDEAGNVTATYVASPTSSDGVCRVDVIHPATKAPWQRLLDIFLPAGFPHSVTVDYVEYQIYDSLQAFSSNIVGLLSSRAVLLSVGVGDADASPTYALLLHIAQESLGRIGTIAFVALYGTALEPECKMYRLLADVFNDFAFVLDCLSPAIPKYLRVVTLSFSSLLKALCGVAAGSAKASLSAHFAQWGNLGELNAKDSSQETVISLLGMWVGSLVLSWVRTPQATWTTLILLLAIHLETNRRAVRAVVMRTLNRQRATLVFHHLQRGHVPTPEEVSKQERIFERGGVLRSADGQTLGFCAVGMPLRDPLWSLAFWDKPGRNAMQTSAKWLKKLVSTMAESPYVLMPLEQSSKHMQLSITLRKDATSGAAIEAWWQALAFAEGWRATKLGHVTFTIEPQIWSVLDASAKSARALLERHRRPLVEAGWNLDNNALETGQSRRVRIE
ncbi:hypothetical protein BAUCODRAFT_147370 [Baudoinia panamericana UAMH 10762]|uniref:Protein root UVB sensitive/RUS domain-containing protein n=1 Tax=Baudoinia panamericana (strain UAMH 10762) TaxID=717646 RepID=M2MZZ7_BAUPA|nr:uncharacterized protein BAUCODRAFT_147370 [Baudoinia panamericana UAMH 10762]EMC97228.1 hypothetical protein BAUCODRAFT_147370 [Baudoinia panamericana UAMH 10762]